MAAVVAVDLANAAMSLRSRPTQCTKELAQSTSGERPMGAAFGNIGGTFNNPMESALEMLLPETIRELLRT